MRCTLRALLQKLQEARDDPTIKASIGCYETQAAKVQGLADKIVHGVQQIADRLGIQERTVKAHMSEIFAKLEVRNHTQAGIAFRRLELVDPSTIQA